MNEPTFLTLTEHEKYQYCPVPPPTTPMRDWRWWSLAVPSVATSFGLFLFGILAVSFTELRSIPTWARNFIVFGGAVLIPLGSELGTVSSVIEIFRKHFGPGGASRADWLGLGFSTATSITAIVLSWAYLLTEDAIWSEEIKTWGPLVFGILLVMDFTFSLLETGSYLGSYDHRFKAWRENDFRPWITGKEEQLNSLSGLTVESQSSWDYNGDEVGLTSWPEEPPVKPGDTPVYAALHPAVIRNIECLGVLPDE